MSHTADTGIEVEGEGFAELVEAAVEGLFGSMFGEIPDVGEGEVEFSAGPGDPSENLVDILAEALYRFEVDDRVPVGPRARVDDEGIVHVRAGTVPAGDLEMIGPPVKAITYHGLEARESGGRWSARVIFDV